MSLTVEERNERENRLFPSLFVHFVISNTHISQDKCNILDCRKTSKKNSRSYNETTPFLCVEGGISILSKRHLKFWMIRRWEGIIFYKMTQLVWVSDELNSAHFADTVFIIQRCLIQIPTLQQVYLCILLTNETNGVNNFPGVKYWLSFTHDLRQRLNISKTEQNLRPFEVETKQFLL